MSWIAFQNIIDKIELSLELWRLQIHSSNTGTNNNRYKVWPLSDARETMPFFPSHGKHWISSMDCCSPWTFIYEQLYSGNVFLPWHHEPDCVHCTESLVLWLFICSFFAPNESSVTEGNKIQKVKTWSRMNKTWVLDPKRGLQIFGWCENKSHKRKLIFVLWSVQYGSKHHVVSWSDIWHWN